MVSTQTYLVSTSIFAEKSHITTDGSKEKEDLR